MTVIMMRPRLREHRDRPAAPSLRQSAELSDLTAKTRAAAIPLLELDGALPVRYIDNLHHTAAVDDLVALRTLRRSRFALEGLRGAGLRGVVDLRSCSQERAGQVELTVTARAWSGRVRLITHADRYGSPAEPSLGSALVTVAGHTPMEHTASLAADPATVRRELTAAVMAAICRDAWTAYTRRHGRGVGAHLTDVAPADRAHHAFDLEIRTTDLDAVVRVGTCGTSAGAYVTGALRFDQLVAARARDEDRLRSALGVDDLAEGLVPFVAELETIAHRYLGLPHMVVA